MFFCNIICCGSSDRREVDRLVVIRDVCVYCNFIIFILNSFKCNYTCAFQCGAVKFEGQGHCSVCFVRCEGRGCCYLFAADEQRLFGFFVHEDTFYGILISCSQVFIHNFIVDRYSFLCQGRMCSCVGVQCCCSDLREVHCLSQIVDISMNSEFVVFVF